MTIIQDGVLLFKHLGNGFSVDELNQKIHVNVTAGGGVADGNTKNQSLTINPQNELVLTDTDGNFVKVALPAAGGGIVERPSCHRTVITVVDTYALIDVESGALVYVPADATAATPVITLPDNPNTGATYDLVIHKTTTLRYTNGAAGTFSDTLPSRMTRTVVWTGTTWIAVN